MTTEIVPSWDNTLNFLAGLTPPISEANDPEAGSLYKWRGLKDRNLEILGWYAGTDESGKKVGRRYNIPTRERVRQIVTRTLKLLHTSAPESLQEQYPWESLSTDKQGRLTAKVAELVTQGKSSHQIQKELGISNKQLNYRRHKLKRRGVKLPPLPPAQESTLVKFASLNNPDITEEEAAKFLDRITTKSRYSILHEAGLIVDLSNLTRKAGLFTERRDIPLIYEELRQQQFPVRKLPPVKEQNKIIGYYYFIATITENKAIQLLQEAPQFQHLKENPVKVVAGQTDKIPNTNALENSGKFAHIGTLIRVMRGVRLSPSSKIKIADIVDGSPIPVFRYGFCHYYPLEQEEELEKYVKGRLRKFDL